MKQDAQIRIMAAGKATSHIKEPCDRIAYAHFLQEIALDIAWGEDVSILFPVAPPAVGYAGASPSPVTRCVFINAAAAAHREHSNR